MSDGTKIEWTDATANVINGCSLESPGCTNCYAMKQAHRFPVRQGLTKKTKGGMVWTGEVRFHEPALLKVLSWRRPRMIFWNAHGDMFHPDVPEEWIDRCFAVMALTPQHVHQVLTKRSARMREYFADRGTAERIVRACEAVKPSSLWNGNVYQATQNLAFRDPLPNVWLGVSVEDQVRADERIPDLLATPAAVRWLSCEPLLGPVVLAHVEYYPGFLLNALTGKEQGGHCPDQPGLDWIVAGGESGPGARPMHPDWVISLRHQCEAASVPFFFKQWGEFLPVDVGTVTQTGIEFHKVGKRAAGRKLHGVLHDGMPVQ